MGIAVGIVPCLSDNYSYLLRVPGTDRAVVVDASEAGPVRAALREHGSRSRRSWRRTTTRITSAETSSS